MVKRLRSLFGPQAEGPGCVTLLLDQKRLRLDFRQHRAWLDEVELQLTAREVFLLERLARQPNEIVTLAELLKATHDLKTDDQEASQLLRPLIRTLRRKLGGSFALRSSRTKADVGSKPSQGCANLWLKF